MAAALAAAMIASDISAQDLGHGRIAGIARDSTGGALAGVTVELRARPSGAVVVTQTDRAGRYQFDTVPPGEFDVAFTLINFASIVRQGVQPKSGQTLSLDVVLHLTLSADVTVTGGARS